MAPKNRLAKMHWELICNFLILWCLIASAAAKCPPEWCGSTNVSYPFWIKNPSCGYPGFQINCMTNVNNSEYAPFLPTPVGNFEILSVSYSGFIIIDSTSLKAMSCNETDDAVVNFNLPMEGPFTISSINRFAVIGCRSKGSFTDNTGTVVGRCESACLNQYDPKYCNTYGCCEAGIPGNWTFINFTGGGISYKDFPGVCGFSTILEPDTFRVPEKEFGVIGRGSYGLRLEWGVGLENCSAARGTSNYSCAEQAMCNDSGEGHVCKCRDGYEGNGYSNGTDCADVNECRLANECVEEAKGGRCQNLPGTYSCYCQNGYSGNGFRNGTECRDVDECSHENECVDRMRGGMCTNLQGSYNCSCQAGYVGNGFQNGTGCKSTNSHNIVVPAIIGSVSSFVGVFLAAFVLFCCLRRCQMKHLHAKYFQQNGGILLQQYIASRRGRDTLKIYSAAELEKASRNYSTDMKLGSGSYGTVFKAIFPDNIVGAIKKSKEISDPQQEDDQFINELIILSQINHRNVVKLLGCCLETQYPLLVYEFVPKGTLRQHIQSEESLLWETRMRIAIETAEALAYLHAASQPIFHRDVKSSNILLDNTYTPKVADFGISRLLDADDTHLTTNVAGTMGYMDPEYFQSFQLTDKSDVYSFGVVLLELLTGQGPLSFERPTDECTLAGLFLSRWNSNRLHEILDECIVNAENRMQMKNMASLARECLHAEGSRRPSMKEVVEELIRIRDASRHRMSCPSDERYDGNEMQMQRKTSDTAEIEMEESLLRGGDFGEGASEGCSVGVIQSFSIDGR